MGLKALFHSLRRREREARDGRGYWGKEREVYHMWAVRLERTLRACL